MGLGRGVADEQVRTDVTLASVYMPFEPPLFFADAGNGDQFAFVVRNRPADVFVWDHETDSRTMVAPSSSRWNVRGTPRNAL